MAYIIKEWNALSESSDLNNIEHVPWILEYKCENTRREAAGSDNK